MRKFQLLQFVVLILFTVSCAKDKDIKTGLSLAKVSGYVQKGPFLNGTAITISELSADLVPTGKNYPSQILDNKGTFEVKNVELTSQFVELKADGFYFNEVSNNNSTAQLTLFALSGLTNKASLNVNVLSTLEKGRVEYLISNGSTFSDAKKKAQSEILTIFEMGKSTMTESELLDITKSGDDNAILLAISVILQGYSTVSDLSELLANISTDIREDGVLNSQTLGSALINNAKTIKLDKIRQNLEARYEILGLVVTIPDFEKYVSQFIANTDFKFTKMIELAKVSGYVQKGPFLNGTTITISELSADLIPTGKNYPSQILDNKGTFEVKNVELTSQFVELKADGFYFNEVSNSNSTAQLTLFALSDLTNKASLNVNVLSTLEKGRVEYLLSKGSTFSDAKKKAQSEILTIFEMGKSAMTESELLDITQSGDDNAILLAISVILQGYSTVSDLSELLANISTDIREDGVLNSQTLGSALINNAKAIKLDQIRKNLEARYETLGLTVTIPDFEKYVSQFIANTDFKFTNLIEYPTSGKNGLNILDQTKTVYSAGNYSMKAVLPEGNSLKVKISGRNWFFPAFQDNTGWEFSDFNFSDNSRVFTSTRTGEIDFKIMFESFQDSASTNKTKIFVFENGDIEATWEKVITMN